MGKATTVGATENKVSMDPIRFVAAVQKVQTLVDGGIRVTLDLAETDIQQAADLMVLKREGIPILVECRMDRES